LPYALALGVEQSWAEKFDAVFERIRAETGKSYSPGWYHGHWDSRDVSSGSMAAKMTGALGSAIAAAASPPGSSSGGGGGGW
jgi:uncharacterized membrane protein